MPTYLSAEDLRVSLALRDLSDPAQGDHALQLLLDAVTAALASRWGCPATTVRSNPLVAVEDNYDRLGFDPSAVTRDQRYSRYVSNTVMLRTHTSAMIPPLLRALAGGGADDHHDRLYVMPGLVYRRDSIDRTHVGEPHQVDLWRVSNAPRMGKVELDGMLDALVDAVLPGAQWRAVPAEHPYTTNGYQLDVKVGGDWLELAECGLIDPGLLLRSGLDPTVWSGLALGMGLDRAVMLRKQIDDIRLLRATDPRVEEQMADLDPWRPVSSMPAVRRDISVVADLDDDEETMGDRIRAGLGIDASSIESVHILAATPHELLPEGAQKRLGILPGQINALIRIVLRPLDRTLTDEEANELRNRAYLAVHRGPHLELI
jgi:phenylalanyl-tRNA synthetase alpha chain